MEKMKRPTLRLAREKNSSPLRIGTANERERNDDIQGEA